MHIAFVGYICSTSSTLMKGVTCSASLPQAKLGEKLLCFCCEFVLAQSFSTLKGVTSLPQAKLWVKNYYVSVVNLFWLNHLAH